MKPRRILQIGYGAFGETHLRAWRQSGVDISLTVADPRPEALAAARLTDPAVAVTADYCNALAACDAADIVTPSDTHHRIAGDAIDGGKPVLIEKPIVVTLVQANDLAVRAARSGTLVRGGYYFRYHPKSAALRQAIRTGRLGRLRFLSARFAGLKRTRTDSGALLNDAVHFLDLFVWLLGQAPHSLYAVTRDHFSRGFEDFALLILHFADGVVAQLETGYVQPGSWPDAVVPGAITSKEIAVSGSEGTIEIDYAAETIVHRAVRHIRRGDSWQPEFRTSPPFECPAADPISVLATELREFVAAIDAKSGNGEDGLDGGVTVARLLEAAASSAATGNVVRLRGAS
jgi:predicted dehydrogenase